MALKYKNNQYLESGKKILYEYKCLVTANPFNKLAHVLPMKNPILSGNG